MQGVDLDLVVISIIALATIAAVFFTVVPVVPGTLFVLLAAAACGLVAGWDGLAWWFWVAQLLLVATYLVIDNVAQVLGVRRVGGSRAAMVGGTIGVFLGPIVLGLVAGPLALFLGPPIGAVVGTLAGEARARRVAGTTTGVPGTTGVAAEVAGEGDAGYVRLGAGALIAFVVGTSLKLLLVTIQVALLVWVV